MAQGTRVLSSDYPDAPLNLNEAAAYLKCATRTIQRLVKDGRLTVCRVRSRRRYLRADLLKAILLPPVGGAP